ncbi:MAG TPA: hypothetical protein ENI17_01745 [Pseudomonas xinjiangensis]|uniref:Uncharacterized protein n=2 Tax=root TaxID=1 RepID=A0A7V1FTV3_9GAMM|nr:hypothetical protein [Halopseudomonas xinjiangensis]HEC46339.1 hypothetical protein [Halopseudomonas xinjiangensis]
MGIIVLVGFGWAVSVYGRPMHFAIGFAAVSAMLGILSGDVLDSLVGGCVSLAFAAAYFWLIDRHSDNVAIYLLILFFGALVWFLGPIWLFRLGA